MPYKVNEQSGVPGSDVAKLLWQLRVDTQQTMLRESLRQPPQTISMDSRSGRGDGESTELVLGSLVTCDISSAVVKTNVVRSDTEESS